MSWYKTAKKFSDEQMAILHGRRPQDYRDEFKEFKAKRNAMKEEARKKAEALGHKLFRNWSPMNSNQCRKCGLTVSLPNAMTQTSSPDAIGGVMMNKCFSHLEHVSEKYFDITDDFLAKGVELNKDQDTSLL